jgi:phosphatidate cytidylyltransferase
MLRDRLIVGPLLIVGLLALLWLDQWLGAVPLPMLVLWETGPGGPGVLPLAAFAGRPDLPAGLVMLGVLLVLIGGGARELTDLFAAKGIRVPAVVLWFGAAVGLLLIYWSPDFGPVQPQLAWFASWLIVVLLVVLRGQTLDRTPDGALTAAAATMLALVYLGTLPGFFLAMRQWHSAWVVAAVVLVTKSCDIGAYFTGKTIGRTKLMPWLSPGKTWEGLIGGMGFAAAVTVGIALIARVLGTAEPGMAIEGELGLVDLAHRVPLLAAAIGGAVLGLVGQGGDLIVSLFKRDAGVKDSGSTIPGFGGVLDVMDSPLLTAPVAYWLLLAVV